MKNLVRISLVALALVFFSVAWGWGQAAPDSYLDAYSSASETKAFLKGDDFDAAAKALEAGSADLANAATAKAAGYVAPKSLIGNVMSLNPDGSVGASTISQWAYSAQGGQDKLTIQLTYGQNAVNLSSVGARGSLFVPGVPVNGKTYRYFVHFKVVSVDELKYSDEAFAAGEFNAYYSGKAGQKSQFTYSCEVLAIENVTDSVKLSVAMP
jgi:hypothetical protein